MSCRYFLSVQITDAWVLINVQIWKLLIEQLGLGKILLWILWITFQFDHCHISHREPSKSVHIPGNGSTCITWSWEKIVSRVSDGGSWMDVMRKSKFLLQEVRESMLQGLNMKTARMLYLFMFWRGGGVEVVLNLSFVWNFFINHILQSPFVHFQSPFMVFEWKYIIVLCLIIPPPLPPSWQIWSEQHILVLYMTIKEKFMEGETMGVDNAAGPIVRRSMAVQL